MTSSQPSRTERESLAAYPTMSQAAEMLGVATSTLSRRRDRQTERRGERDLIMRPGEVLRLAYLYRKRSVNEVAAALIDLAEFHGEGDEIEAEVEAFFSGGGGSVTTQSNG